MLLFAVSGKANPGTMEEFAQKWQDVYRSHFPQMPGFVQAYFSANHEANTWLAVALWSAQPDETQLRQAIQELGGKLRPSSLAPLLPSGLKSSSRSHRHNPRDDHVGLHHPSGKSVE